MVIEDNGGRLIGFAHAVFDEDPTWGALLDHLPVAHGHKRRGIGSQLLALTASAVIQRRTGLHLWCMSRTSLLRASMRPAAGSAWMERPSHAHGATTTWVVRHTAPARASIPSAEPEALPVLDAAEQSPMGSDERRLPLSSGETGDPVGWLARFSARTLHRPQHSLRTSAGSRSAV
ncbi:MAG: GNAT family N-acetyltransferase [Solirubrobacteraceae bacterium]